MPDQVAGQLGRGGDDGVDEAVAAGGGEAAAYEAVGFGGSAADRGGGQQELADQRVPRRQAVRRERPQLLARGLVVAGAERDPGEQQLAVDGGQPAGQPKEVAGQPQQRFQRADRARTGNHRPAGSRAVRRRQIAARLVLSPATAKTHGNRAMAKLGARDRAQLVVVAYQPGLVRADDTRRRLAPGPGFPS